MCVFPSTLALSRPSMGDGSCRGVCMDGRYMLPQVAWRVRVDGKSPRPAFPRAPHVLLPDSIPNWDCNGWQFTRSPPLDRAPPPRLVFVVPAHGQPKHDKHNRKYHRAKSMELLPMPAPLLTRLSPIMETSPSSARRSSRWRKQNGARINLTLTSLATAPNGCAAATHPDFSPKDLPRTTVH